MDISVLDNAAEVASIFCRDVVVYGHIRIRLNSRITDLHHLLGGTLLEILILGG